MAWTCSKCTFSNPSSQQSSCQMCGSSSTLMFPSPSPSAPTSFSPPGTPKWSCKSCTLLNPYRNTSCEACGVMAPISSISTMEEFMGVENDADSSIGSVFFPLRRCTKVKNDPSDRVADSDGFRNIQASRLAATASGDSKAPTLKIMTYNVWFREDLELYKRMKAIGELIQLHSPDLICLQEVTPNIYDIFLQSSWWKSYNCSVSRDEAITKIYFCMQLSKLPVKSFSRKPFRNSVMGRELCIAEIEAQPNKPLVIATSHLESPCPAPPRWDQMYTRERVDQAREALTSLKNSPNVIFCGDTNWDDRRDGQFPLPAGFVDAWTELRPGEIGWTYDTKSNLMLSGNRTLQKRLDRFACCLGDFKLSRIEMIGTEAIPGLSHLKEKKGKETKNLVLPVLPSDHYGLVLTIGAL